MFDGSQAVLLWMLEPGEPLEDEWNEWYDTEHVPALMSVPGFLNGSRFRVDEHLGGAMPPRFLAYYELAGLDVLESEEYHRNRASLGPGMRRNWTRRMLAEVVRAAGGQYTVAGEWTESGQPLPGAPEQLLVIGLGPSGASDEGVVELLSQLRGSPAVLGYRDLSLHAGSPQIKGMMNREESPRRLIVCAVSTREDLAVDSLIANRDLAMAASYRRTLAAVGRPA